VKVEVLDNSLLAVQGASFVFVNAQDIL